MIRTMKRGFTLPEMIMVMGIITTLIGLSTINLLPVQSRTSLSTSVESLITDIKTQQGKAMSGETYGTSSRRWGIYIGADHYVLFQGDAYDANDTANFVWELPPEFSLNSNFTDSQIVFEVGSGEIVGHVPEYYMTLTDDQSGEAETLVLNKYGVVE
jgi:prepilin-type N-terminal cleavage/methylation domain-containing protein